MEDPGGSRYFFIIGFALLTLSVAFSLSHFFGFKGSINVVAASVIIAVFAFVLSEITRKPKSLGGEVFDSSQKRAIDVLIPLRNVVTYRPSTTLLESFCFFEGHKYTHVPVLDDSGRKVIGIVRMEDVAAKILLGPNSGSLPVTSVMLPAHYVQAEESISEMFKTLKEDSVHLFVVLKDGYAVGILSSDDLLREVAEMPEAIHAPCKALGTAHSGTRTTITND